MINFSQYLTEARMAPLYHAANVTIILSILSSGGIDPKTKHMNIKLMKKMYPGVSAFTDENITSGVSTTRNPRFAEVWANGSYIELDQVSLAQNYKIIPIQFWQSLKPKKNDGDYSNVFRVSPARNTGEHYSSTNEFEEFIVSKKKIPLKYFKRIFIRTDKDPDIVAAIRDTIKAKKLKIEVVNI